MITWILGGILIIWVLIRRFSKDGKVEGYPFSMPRGTIRAIITVMVIAFPFNYLLTNQEIPGIITSSIFILLAFYFEARKGEKEQIDMIKEIKDPIKFAEEKKKQKKPLYLPKYSVRISLVLILTIIIVTNYFGPNVPFETTNTFLDILIIVLFYFTGVFFGSIIKNYQKKKLKKVIETIPDYETKSKYEILDILMERKAGIWKRAWRNLISLLTFVAVTLALIAFTINWDFTIPFFSFFDLSLRETLLLIINVYYGFRD